MNKKQKKKCQRLANRHRPNHDRFIEMPVMNWDRKIVGYWHTPELKKDKGVGLNTNENSISN